MPAIPMRMYFGGSRVLVAKDESGLSIPPVTAAIRAGATVFEPDTTLSQMRALISRTKPAIAILGPFADTLNPSVFMFELFERHLPGLFYIKVLHPLPLLSLNRKSAFVERVYGDEPLSAIAARSCPSWQARPALPRDAADAAFAPIR